MITLIIRHNRLDSSNSRRGSPLEIIEKSLKVIFYLGRQKKRTITGNDNDEGRDVGLDSLI